MIPQSNPVRPREESSATPKAESIEEVFAALESPLLSYALRLVRERSLAEDMVQEAFLRLNADYQQVREPRRWLYRTVHNLALNYRRSAGRMIPLETTAEGGPAVPDLKDPQPLPDEQIARLEAVGLVRLSLATLDTRSQELIHLKFTEGLSYREMSAQTGLTVGHVGYLLHHALKEIAAHLSRKGEAQ